MHLVRDRAVQTFPSHLNFKTSFKQAKVMHTTTTSFACRTVAKSEIASIYYLAYGPLAVVDGQH